eukprot:11292703-Alexandrium_andersonii.AAC.1
MRASKGAQALGGARRESLVKRQSGSRILDEIHRGLQGDGMVVVNLFILSGRALSHEEKVVRKDSSAHRARQRAKHAEPGGSPDG